MPVRTSKKRSLSGKAAQKRAQVTLKRHRLTDARLPFLRGWGACPWHAEVPGSGVKLAPQQRPEPIQWQHWIINPLHHKDTPLNIFTGYLIGILNLDFQKQIIYLQICSSGDLQSQQTAISFFQLLKPKNLKSFSWLLSFFHTLYPFLQQFFFFFCLFRAAPEAYGGSQARSQIGVATAGLRHSHSNVRSESHLGPTPQLMVTLDP